MNTKILITDDISVIEYLQDINESDVNDLGGALRKLVREHRAMRDYIIRDMGDIDFWICAQGHINSIQDETCWQCDAMSWRRAP